MVVIARDSVRVQGNVIKEELVSSKHLVSEVEMPPTPSTGHDVLPHHRPRKN